MLENLVQNIKIPRWSTFVPIISYLIFISLVLNFSFPLKKFANKNVKPSTTTELTRSGNKYPELSALVLFNSSPDERKVLETAFKDANANNDSYLSIQELGRYINKRIRDHIDNAIRMNPISFSQIDLSPRDGLITWEEYHTYFLRQKGMSENYISQHSEEKHIKLNRKAKEEIMRDKALWAEAARSDPFSLTLDEFLAFRHPESSAVNLLSLVDDLLRQFDVDGDDCLTSDEFADVTVNDEDEKYRKSIVTKTVGERKEEFKRIIDKNKDGKADRGELLAYIDPRHPRYALQEAATLVKLADKNKDNFLILDEILNSSSLFMSSKMIDTSNSFHDEF